MPFCSQILQDCTLPGLGADCADLKPSWRWVNSSVASASAKKSRRRCACLDVLVASGWRRREPGQIGMGTALSVLPILSAIREAKDLTTPGMPQAMPARPARVIAMPGMEH